MPIKMLFDPRGGGEESMLLPSNPEHFVPLQASAVSVDGESAKAARTQNKDKPLSAARKFSGPAMPGGSSAAPNSPASSANPTSCSPIDQSTGRLLKSFEWWVEDDVFCMCVNINRAFYPMPSAPPA
jgi:hypothetical protein